MANNYLEFAEVLPNLTAEEEAWLKHQLERVIVAPDGQEYPKDAPEAAEVDDPVFDGPRAFRDFQQFMEMSYDGQPEFQYLFDDPVNASEDPWGRHLFIYAEEAGQPDQPAHLVRKFLQRFRPDDHWTLGYACWSDACGVGEFGGGALFVTADRTQSVNSFDFLEEAETEFKAREPRQAAVERLAALAAGLGLFEDSLDEIIREMVSQEASGINNGGLPAKIAYLVEQIGPERTENAILKAV